MQTIGTSRLDVTRSILLFVVMIYKQADCRPLVIVIEGYPFYTIESWVKKRMSLVLNEFILT
jgi:hypothetical protein